jgi:hypothetical protein
MEELTRQQNHGGHPIRPPAHRVAQRQAEQGGSQMGRREDQERDQQNQDTPSGEGEE